jgi:hypothetical protein
LVIALAQAYALGDGKTALTYTEVRREVRRLARRALPWPGVARRNAMVGPQLVQFAAWPAARFSCSTRSAAT